MPSITLGGARAPGYDLTGSSSARSRALLDRGRLADDTTTLVVLDDPRGEPQPLRRPAHPALARSDKKADIARHEPPFASEPRLLIDQQPAPLPGEQVTGPRSVNPAGWVCVPFAEITDVSPFLVELVLPLQQQVLVQLNPVRGVS